MKLNIKQHWSEEDIKNIKAYKKTWSKKQKHGMKIAQELLESSFDITLSNGMKSWKTSHDK